MFQNLFTLVLAIWKLMDPALARSPDARAIAMAAAEAFVQEASRAPVFGSHDVDLAVFAVYAAGESGVRRSPKPQSWDAKAGVSCGMVQEPCEFVLHHSLTDQVHLWMHYLRVGKKDCPDAPASMLGGDCHIGRPLAEYRFAVAVELLREVLRQDLVPASQ